MGSLGQLRIIRGGDGDGRQLIWQRGDVAVNLLQISGMQFGDARVDVSCDPCGAFACGANKCLSLLPAIQEPRLRRALGLQDSLDGDNRRVALLAGPWAGCVRISLKGCFHRDQHQDIAPLDRSSSSCV